MARRFLTGIDLAGQRLTGIADGTAANDAASVAQVDAARRGLDVKDAARAASTANIDLTTGGLLTVDGVALAAGNRVLVKNQTTAAQNGIYVAAAGAWTRAVDADANSEVTQGLSVAVTEGTTKGTGTSTTAPVQYVLTTADPITVGTTALTFAVVGGAGGTSYAAGNGLTLTGSTFTVDPDTGIVVGAGGVGIDTAVVARKYAVTIGDGTATSFTITHNLNTRDVQVTVFAAADPGAEVEVDVEHPSGAPNAVILRFASAPTTGQYRAVCQG